MAIGNKQKRLLAGVVAFVISMSTNATTIYADNEDSEGIVTTESESVDENSDTQETEVGADEHNDTTQDTDDENFSLGEDNPFREVDPYELNQQDEDSGSGSAFGNAYGKEAIELVDGKWYVFHATQTECNCRYCGTWSNAVCIDDGIMSGKVLGAHGTSLYCLATVVSNLSLHAVNPKELLVSMGANLSFYGNCIFTKGINRNYNGILDANLHINNIDSCISFLQDKYDISASKIEAETLEDFKTAIDNVLNNSGMVMAEYKVSVKDKTLRAREFPKRLSANGEYIVIRSVAGSDYYIIEPVGALNLDYLNTPVSIETLYKVCYEKTHNAIGFTSSSAVESVREAYDIGSGVLVFKDIPWGEHGMHEVNYSDKLSKFSEFTNYNTGITLNNNTNYMCQGFKAAGGGQITVKDNTPAVAIKVPPAIIDDKYFSDSHEQGNWLNATSEIDKNKYKNKKLAVVLKSTSSDEIYYLPCIVEDIEEYSFPCGVANTGIKSVSNSTIDEENKFICGDLETLDKTGYAKDSIGNLPEFLNNVKIGNSQVNSYDIANSGISLLNIPKSAYANLKSNFIVTDFIIWD